MFVVEIGAAITTVGWLIQAFGGEPLGGGNEPAWFTFTVAIWLWLTVVFANLAEALAEGRGQGSGRRACGRRAPRPSPGCTTAARCRRRSSSGATSSWSRPARSIPGDGTVIEGIASVDESAITGESAPVIREAGGDRSAVTGGTRVLSDRIVVEITQEPGKSFLDRMITLVEGAERRKTPNEIALNILLAGLTIIFLVVVVALRPFAEFSATDASVATLIALLVALIPTTIGALLSAIGIAGMDRLVRRNVLALSGRAVEASGDVDALLLDKTGTITLGNREATEFIPMPGVSEAELAEAAQMASLADETPEGRSIVVLAKQFGIREHEFATARRELRPVQRRDPDERRRLQRNAACARAPATRSCDWVEAEGGQAPPELAGRARPDRPRGRHAARRRPRQPGARRHLPQGRGQGGDAPALRPAPRDGHPHGDGDRRQPPDRRQDRRRVRRRRFPRRGDPGAKLELIRERAGRRAPDRDDRRRHQRRTRAGSGRRRRDDEHRHPGRARGGNMVDLDSNPTKLIEIVEVGKQLLITRGALTTFSIANDVAKYFAILPAIFAATYATGGRRRAAREAQHHESGHARSRRSSRRSSSTR